MHGTASTIRGCSQIESSAIASWSTRLAASLDMPPSSSRISARDTTASHLARSMQQHQALHQDDQGETIDQQNAHSTQPVLDCTPPYATLSTSARTPSNLRGQCVEIFSLPAYTTLWSLLLAKQAAAKHRAGGVPRAGSRQDGERAFQQVAEYGAELRFLCAMAGLNPHWISERFLASSRLGRLGKARSFPRRRGEAHQSVTTTSETLG